MDKRRTSLGRVGSIGTGILRGLRAGTLVRLLGTPFQRLFDRPGGTHRFLTERAVSILRADGFTQTASLYEEWLETLVRGNYWADALWMNATHHYNPATSRGLWIWPGAADQMKHWYKSAVSLWKQGRHEESMFKTGACLHLVQDCCQPYHSNCVVFDGHQDYERWADAHKEDYVVSEGGLYGVSPKPEGWVVANAQVSHGHLKPVSQRSGNGREKSTRLLLPRAMRSSAGFLLFFKEEAMEMAASPGLKKSAAG